MPFYFFKLSKAIKQLVANHRLILSGTPIQNNVLELWSLFDFLMPGFLGTEKQFTARYSKPILLSRDAKSSSKEQEAGERYPSTFFLVNYSCNNYLKNITGALAMESLHRQVLPFLLRRMKEDVLKDLPPKIIQDYYCDLSSLQVQLYEDFAKSRAKRSLEESLTSEDSGSNHGASHIFQVRLGKIVTDLNLIMNESYELFLCFCLKLLLVIISKFIFQRHYSTSAKCAIIPNWLFCHSILSTSVSRRT